jgi:hypothetical protein
MEKFVSWSLSVVRCRTGEETFGRAHGGEPSGARDPRRTGGCSLSVVIWKETGGVRAGRFGSVEGVGQGVVRLREPVTRGIPREVGNGERSRKFAKPQRTRKEFDVGFLNFRGRGTSNLARQCERYGGSGWRPRFADWRPV